MIEGAPYIPEYITVHLGPPDSDARNVTVPFPDYIKNVASSEIYPTWPENAIRANIYAQVSFALNRIYNEWYRSKGYNFDITSSTAFDQKYIYGRDTFQNVDDIVDELFNDYIKRRGDISPLAAKFCNGTTVTCDGLSQWGSVDLAQQGYTPYEILQFYYGDEIDIVSDAPVRNFQTSYPGSPLKEGDRSSAVRAIQVKLNRIGRNYPMIPYVNPDGYFGPETRKAVLAFQSIFNMPETGIVNSSVWYKISYIYAAVKQLSELSSEGITFEELAGRYPDTVKPGEKGNNVRLLQYILNLLSDYYSYIPRITIDGVYGPKTQEIVKEFQRKQALTPDGVVEPKTWQKLLVAYLGIEKFLSPDKKLPESPLVPQLVLKLGDEGDDVKKLQELINDLSKVYENIPSVAEDGIYGEKTQAAVKKIQELFGLSADGTAGPKTFALLGLLCYSAGCL